MMMYKLKNPEIQTEKSEMINWLREYVPYSDGMLKPQLQKLILIYMPCYKRFSMKMTWLGYGHIILSTMS
jgi:hypothetical protein